MNKTYPLLLVVALACSLEVAAQSTVESVITNRLADPRSLAIVDADIYLSDSGSHRILKYAPDTGLLSAVAGRSGLSGTNNGPGFLARFFSPKGLASAAGGLVVADSGNHCLRLVDVNGSIPLVTNLAGRVGVRGFNTDDLTIAGVAYGVPADQAVFNTPVGLATDPEGNLFIADSKNNAIRLFTQIADADFGNTNRVITISTNFLEPSAVAVGDRFGPDQELVEIFVADTRNHAIKLFGFDTRNRVMTTNRLSANAIAVTHLAGSSARVAGTNDALFAEESLFNLPSNLLWSGPTVGLIVSDTGNHTLRRVFRDPIFQDPIFQDPNILQFLPKWNPTNQYSVENQFSVETYGGIPALTGTTDGPLRTARFNSPTGLVRDSDGDLWIADSGNNALRRIQTAPRLPPVANPKLGYIIFILDQETGALVSQLVPITEATFNNDTIIAALGEDRTETFFTTGVTPGLFQADTIPIPNSGNSQPAPPYVDGLPPAQVKPSLIEPRLDLTIKAISTAAGRRPSDVVQARVQFKVATPTILGDNPASFTLTNETAGADMWYTLDGSTPTNEPPSIQALANTISLRITNEVTFRARGFKRNYKPSEVATKTFVPEDFQANDMTFGFARGEGSSQFIGSAGQNFIAPVTLSLLPNQKIYSLQFNVTVTNRDNAISVTPGAYNFQSMLLESLFDPVLGLTIERVIPPRMFDHYRIIEIITNGTPQGIIITTNREPVFQDLLVANPSQNLLGVGWLELFGRTNLYNTRGQELISISQAHDRRFLSSEGKIVLGGYSFQIPAAASVGSNYRISLGRPSASDALSRDVFIDTPTDGSFGGGAINSIKDVQVVDGGIGAGQLHYIVGDTYPFRWYNAGDFGDSDILNNDLLQVFQAAIHQYSIPPQGTDFFDTMDSCCNGSSGPVVGNVFDGSQTNINQITLGNGILDVADVFVTFRRSLDPSLKWYARYWINGQRQAAEVPNQFRGKLNGRNKEGVAPLANLPAETLSAAAFAQKPSVIFRADDLQVSPGEMVRVPIRAEVAGPYPVRVLLFDVTVEPLDGSPPLLDSVVFVPVAQLGAPTLKNAVGRGNFAGAWLDHTVPGVRGTAEIGSLLLTVPPQASPDAAYRIHFAHVSASPNGFSVFPMAVTDGLLTTAQRETSTPLDGIPDSWRLRYFGSVRSYLSHANADADADGLSNSVEYNIGSNPNDARSNLRLTALRKLGSAPGPLADVILRWPTAKGRSYSLESTPWVSGSGWTPVATGLSGTGHEMEFILTPTTALPQFYRVLVTD